MRNAKWPWFVVAGTWLLVVVILLKVLVTGALIDGADSGGRTAALVLAIVGIIPLFIQEVRLLVPRWLPWAIGGISVLTSGILWLLVISGRDSLAWSAYGGLQVLRAKQPFNDLAWVLRSIDCGGCSSESTGYGPGILWVKSITLGLVNPALTHPLGLTMVLFLGVGLVWVARNSAPRGQLLLLLTSVGCGWLLLLDRANLDALAFLLPILAIILMRRWNSLWSWGLLAGLIWIFGTWKYYPFALGVLLIPSLFIRRGWIVFTAFVTASSAYMLVYWSEFVDSSAQNGGVVVLGDFPGFGRLPIIARMTSHFEMDRQPLLANILVLCLCLAAFVWGLNFSRHLKSRNIANHLLATSGSIAFLAAALVAGFGFAYKSAFLLLLVPLMSLPVRRSGRFPLYTSLVCLILIGIPVLVGYSILLTSLASLLAASIGLGAGGYGLIQSSSRNIRASKALPGLKDVPAFSAE